MSELINGLDNFTPTKLGENGHLENTWSNNIKENIIQLSFQLTRTNENTIKNLKEKFKQIISRIQNDYRSNNITEDVYKSFVLTLYKLIANTRDIIDGKGEYALSYMLLLSWYQYYPEQAKFLLKCFVEMEDGEHPYGSWKDIKYFADLCKLENKNHPLIEYCVKLLNDRIRTDLLNDSHTISLCAKWIPREKSQFGWLFTRLATDFFKSFLPENECSLSYDKAVLKCKTKYRQLLSSMNVKLNTVQVLQCANNWSEIVPSKQTSITMKRQSKAFLNVTKKGVPRNSSIPDRIECATHFKEFIDKAANGEVTIKGKRVGLNEFVEEAIKLNNYPNQLEIKLLNAQWIDNATQNKALGKMIPMVDVSGSMSGDPLHSAIALGIRVSENSIIGNRIMTFSEIPTWVNLDGISTFVEKVKIMQTMHWGMTTNFFSALKMILSVIVEKKMKAEDVCDMTLAIFSDMQINQAGTSNNDLTMYGSIKKLYHDTGIAVCGEPYCPPHILFWNLRSTDGFPCVSTQKNISMMSGFSPVLLNQFCENGITASSTPWETFNTSLLNKRYDILNSVV